MTFMDIVDMAAPNMKNTVVTLTKGSGIGSLELLVRVPVAVMHPHTAPLSYVKVRVLEKSINSLFLSKTIFIQISTFNIF